jgi:hypothetical protein
MDVYAIVTRRLLACSKAASCRGAGRGPLPDCFAISSPGSRIGASTTFYCPHRNTSRFWLTMRQENGLGGSIRKTEESMIVTCWKIDDAKRSDTELRPRRRAEG